MADARGICGIVNRIPLIWRPVSSVGIAGVTAALLAGLVRDFSD